MFFTYCTIICCRANLAGPSSVLNLQVKAIDDLLSREIFEDVPPYPSKPHSCHSFFYMSDL